MPQGQLGECDKRIPAKEPYIKGGSWTDSVAPVFGLCMLLAQKDLSPECHFPGSEKYCSVRKIIEEKLAKKNK